MYNIQYSQSIRLFFLFWQAVYFQHIQLKHSISPLTMTLHLLVLNLLNSILVIVLSWYINFKVATLKMFTDIVLSRLYHVGRTVANMLQSVAYSFTLCESPKPNAYMSDFYSSDSGFAISQLSRFSFIFFPLYLISHDLHTSSFFQKRTIHWFLIWIYALIISKTVCYTTVSYQFFITGPSTGTTGHIH